MFRQRHRSPQDEQWKERNENRQMGKWRLKKETVGEKIFKTGENGEKKKKKKETKKARSRNGTEEEKRNNKGKYKEPDQKT